MVKTLVIASGHKEAQLASKFHQHHPSHKLTLLATDIEANLYFRRRNKFPKHFFQKK